MLWFKNHKIKKFKKKIRALQSARENNPAEEDALYKERRLYRDLAGIYQKLRGNKKYPFAELHIISCYRAAASIDDVDAKYWLGERMLEEAKEREAIEKEKLFANNVNERNMKQLYEEAHAWLESAKQFKHILAYRLSGLCYINSWGVDSDKDKGFDMVVHSIELENSWEKVPEIFAKIGLNKPEFFSALTTHRKKRSGES
jgi:hypothetical protein